MSSNVHVKVPFVIALLMPIKSTKSFPYFDNNKNNNKNNKNNKNLIKLISHGFTFGS